ncbi:hypothetical protein AMS58_06435 [Pseudoalteromonas porphyrae]|uniref:Uncharacterized protein n=1 Tax=Pseudoalteromonas neustonica TaxID=1840331 RepID=A0ABU9TYE4_9GAMM|nr:MULTISPECIES: hypothetical protein [Pseudoalteromonas]KPH95359.1 hypothetical protein AMS58_06435 [Pseudoalteromonas porphyrae]NNG42002.1 hypothetical protein [Pseudoalteromonas sp. NEC-BIFX-2020_002]
MHPRYAAIFGIENLELNQHFRPQSIVEQFPDQTMTAPQVTLELNQKLLADLNRAIAPEQIKHVVQSDTLAWHEGQLSLPNQQLSADNKRALWALMSIHLDNL